ncbi:hypothetical protein HHK36_006673 [Tetracentron sinense]|uniref:NADP-dependent oxidoreductase domain-containing protein n=1 Tax=Tetracentron sinense TaxID=13715 RepID=A0A835DPC1_TETSI|nr:hypothetical protein HHK36_006673 [Tetracentron sinense]
MGENVPSVLLSSGWKMPIVALGTATQPLPHQVLTSTFIDAIEVGYRHFDTAALYKTEEPLGHAVAEALRRGLIGTRDNLFITSKLWCTDAHPDLVVPALKNTLRKLGLEYVDLYLVHVPARLKKGEMVYPFNKEDLLPFDMRGTWEAMEECSRLGLAKSIGVSNFDCEKLSQLLGHATIPPAVNQVKLNAACQQRKLIDFCKEKGIHVSAWSPLGANGTRWGSTAVMDSPILKEIALAKGKTVALRWIYEQGASVVVKSFNKGRMKENLQIFGWELSGEELNKISQIPQQRGFPDFLQESYILFMVLEPHSSNESLKVQMATESFAPSSLPIIQTTSSSQPLPNNLIAINSNTLPLKLTSSNYSSWQAQLDALLLGYGLVGFVDGTYPCSSPSIEENGKKSPKPKYLFWIRQDKLLFLAILGSITDTIAPMVSRSKTS